MRNLHRPWNIAKYFSRILSLDDYRFFWNFLKFAKFSRYCKWFSEKIYIPSIIYTYIYISSIFKSFSQERENFFPSTAHNGWAIGSSQLINASSPRKLARVIVARQDSWLPARPFLSCDFFFHIQLRPVLNYFNFGFVIRLEGIVLIPHHRKWWKIPPSRLRFMSTRLCESAGYVERNHEWATSGRESLERASITEEEIVALYREFNRRLQFLIISSRAFYFIFFLYSPSVRYPVWFLIDSYARSLLLLSIKLDQKKRVSSCNRTCFDAKFLLGIIIFVG